VEGRDAFRIPCSRDSASSRSASISRRSSLSGDARRAVGIKQLLMNANVMVGVGNIYANESLFRAGIHPRARSGSLSRARCERLVAAVRDVLLAAIAAGGSSLRDFVRSDGSPGIFSSTTPSTTAPRFRAGLRAAIRVSRTGQRSSFFCTTCQKK